MRVRTFLKSHRLTLRQVPVWIAGMVLTSIWIIPFLLMLSASLAAPGSSQRGQYLPSNLSLDNYVAVVGRYHVLEWAINSTIVTLAGTALGVALAAMAGFALARLRFPGRSAIFGVVLGTLMIPFEMTMVPMYIGFLTLGLANTLTGMILPSIASVIALFIFRQFFLGLPRDLDDAAEVDGAGKFTIFTKIALPLSRGPAFAVTILLFAANWNAYTWPLLIALEERTKTLPVGLAQLTPSVGHGQSIQIGLMMAAATILSAPTILVFLFLQKYFIEGIARSGLKG